MGIISLSDARQSIEDMIYDQGTFAQKANAAQRTLFTERALPAQRTLFAERASDTERALPQGKRPFLLLEGEALAVLRFFPTASIDCVMTSPPYWNQREYASADAIGGEASREGYIEALLAVFGEVKRVLKPKGSFWLNLGDTYKNKNLCGMPWRVAIALQDSQGWILRNSIVWNKQKGAPDNSKDKLRNIHEYVFHFVKQKKYYYEVNSIRNAPKAASIQNGRVVTATGVTGVKYRRQIKRSTSLTSQEKQFALQALDETLAKVANGELPDFRMVIRGQQRVTHSSSTNVSGRAKELEEKGYYILPYHKKGSKPSDVWEIIPEDSWRKDSHAAPFPEELCHIPIKASCPENGIVLDPFVGTGTTVLAALKLCRRGIGIDLSREYLEVASDRLSHYQPLLL